jgi:hypothetical protein
MFIGDSAGANRYGLASLALKKGVDDRVFVYRIAVAVRAFCHLWATGRSINHLAAAFTLS